jgi:hypothetical protein
VGTAAESAQVNALFFRSRLRGLHPRKIILGRKCSSS